MEIRNANQAVLNLRNTKSIASRRYISPNDKRRNREARHVIKVENGHVFPARKEEKTLPVMLNVPEIDFSPIVAIKYVISKYARGSILEK